MRKMPLMDAFFLINESRHTPMHVAGVNLFTLPKGVEDTEFLAQLGDIMSYDGELRRPFGEKLKTGPLGAFGPVYWEDDHLLDMDYHIRHSALPKPGRYRELFGLVSRLHSTLLERERPLWEMHLIEGLQNRQFATYFKTHHCAIDGVGAMQLTMSMYSNSARSKVKQSPLSYESYIRDKKAMEAKRGVDINNAREDEVRNVLELVREQLDSTSNVTRALRDYAGVWLGRSKKLSVPVHNVPRTAFNTQISGARRFVAQSWPLARIKAMGKAYGGTLNDAVLAMCSGALRRHLLEQKDLPDQPLKAMAPVSLRNETDLDSANAVGFLTANLATNERDPAVRMQVIQDSMRAAKDQLKGMSRREIEIYTIITQAPALLLTMSGMGTRFPAFSTVISNVPGPRQQMYWNGARLDGMYPVSIPFNGFAINITLVSNNDNLDFGIVACRRSVPQVQRLIDYMEEALRELEQAAGLRSPRRSTTGSGARIGRKPTGKSRAKTASKPAAKKAVKAAPAKTPAKKKPAAAKPKPKTTSARKPATPRTRPVARKRPARAVKPKNA